MKRTLYAIFALCAASAFAAVPIHWTVDINRASAPTFDLYHGESADVRADLVYRGSPFLMGGEAHLYWQTNGMGSLYWDTPAAIASNTISAAWAPTNDVGAAAYNCFLGIPGSNYRAAFRLRMLASPGATPSELPLPTKSIDFAQVEVRNAPWATTNDFYFTSIILWNVATNAQEIASNAVEKADAAQATADGKVDKMTTTDGKLYSYVHTKCCVR